MQALRHNVLAEIQDPAGQLAVALSAYKETTERLEALFQEKEHKLAHVHATAAAAAAPNSTTSARSPDGDDDDNDKELQEIKAAALVAIEEALKKIDADEEKLVAQLKIKYLTMRLPTSQSDANNDDDEYRV